MPHINRLQQVGILIECQSSWNTSILPVKKEGGQDYRPVQDLRLVKQAAVTLHPTLPNPYTLVSLFPLSAKIYTYLDLKDAFIWIHIALVSQPIFAFDWEDPAGGTKQQLTWTRLPQEFKNSPNTPVFLPGESQGRGSLVGCCLWGRTEADTTEVT